MKIVFFLVFSLTVSVFSLNLVINTIPGASIYVNGQLKVQTNGFKVTLELEPGFYDLTVTKPGYSRESKRIELKDNTSITLIPKAFGEIDIITTPPARIYINNNLYGISPLKIKLPEGKYNVKFELDGYLSTEKQLILEPFKTIEIHQSLIKFGTLQIESSPKSAKVFMDGDLLGITPFSTSVTPGKHVFKFELEGYLPQNVKVNVSQEPQKIFVELQPSANLLISGTPVNSKIFIDDNLKGFAPLSVENLAVGEYVITVEATGFETLKKRISLKKGKNFFNYSLKKKSFSINLESLPTGAMLFLDNKFIGFTPLKNSVDYGVHEFKLKKDNLEWVYKAEISENRNFLVDLEKTSTLILDSKQKDTFVDFKGNLIKLPAVINLPEGAYKLIFVNPNFQNRIRYIMLEGGKVHKIDVDMSGESYLSVVTVPQGIDIYWKNEYLGKTPLFMKKISSGKGSLRLVSDNIEKDLEIEINDGEYKNVYETFLDRMIKVYFVSVPDKAKVYVNGIFVGETPVSFNLKPDVYEVVYEKNGYFSQKMKLDLRFDLEVRYLNMILEKVK